MANPQPNIWHAPMPLICSSFEPGHLDDVIEAMPDNDYRTIALAEAAYFRGKADEACRLAEPFLTSDVLALRISSCFICGFANLSLDHAHAARACLLNLASSEEHLNDEYGDRERAAYLLFTASSSVLLHLKPPVTADDFYKVADSLTTTEFAISMLACRGWSNTEIADHMGISRGTVKNRLSTTYAKLGITSRSGLKEFMLK